MTRWKRKVDELLYDGESVRETVDVGTSRVVVTSHRLLAFTPDADGENLRQADLPNVESVAAGSATDGRQLRRALSFGIVGGVLAVAGVLLDFGEMFGDVDLDSGAAGGGSVGDLIGVAETLVGVMEMLDLLLLVAGLLSLSAMALFIGIYLFQRDPTVVIGIAGETADIHLPRSGEAAETRQRLEAAIFPDTGATAAGAHGAGDATPRTDGADDAGFGEATHDTGFGDGTSESDPADGNEPLFDDPPSRTGEDNDDGWESSTR